MSGLTLTPLTGFPPIEPGDSLPELVRAALARAELQLIDGDILVVCQKAVSKAEGRVVRLQDVRPSPFALAFAKRWPDKDPRFVELVLQHTGKWSCCPRMRTAPPPPYGRHSSARAAPASP